jgi:hypothetical protein
MYDPLYLISVSNNVVMLIWVRFRNSPKQLAGWYCRRFQFANIGNSNFRLPHMLTLKRLGMIAELAQSLLHVGVCLFPLRHDSVFGIHQPASDVNEQRTDKH